MNRIEMHGDYLIVAPAECGTGYEHMLTERAYLVDNMLNFLTRHTYLDPHRVTIYELVEVNLSNVVRLDSL